MSGQEAVFAVFVAVAGALVLVDLVVIIRCLRSSDRPISVRRTTDQARSAGGYPSGSQLRTSAFVIKPRALATGLFRETAHECCPPVLTARGSFRFRCPVCHSEFEKVNAGDWELAQRHGVQWAAVDGDTAGDKPGIASICNDADHHPHRCDCGRGRPS